MYFFDLLQTNPKNGRVKALSKACLDWTYFVWNVKILDKILRWQNPIRVSFFHKLSHIIKIFLYF